MEERSAVTTGKEQGTRPLPYDDVDRRLISVLQEDGRASNTAIARRLGMTEATVRRRIDRLIATGTLRIVAVPSPETVGLTLSAIIGVSCDLKQLDEIAKTVASFTETRYLGYSTGTCDLMIEAFFYSHEHLLDYLTRKLATIEGIRRTETQIILKVAKFSFEWELPATTELLMLGRQVRWAGKESGPPYEPR